MVTWLAMGRRDVNGAEARRRAHCRRRQAGGQAGMFSAIKLRTPHLCAPPDGLNFIAGDFGWQPGGCSKQQ